MDPATLIGFLLAFGAVVGTMVTLKGGPIASLLLLPPIAGLLQENPKPRFTVYGWEKEFQVDLAAFRGHVLEALANERPMKARYSPLLTASLLGAVSFGSRLHGIPRNWGGACES